MTHHNALKLCLAGAAIAAIGVSVGFLGFYIELRAVSVAGFVITVLGIALGFLGILLGWAMFGKQSIQGSKDASKLLRKKIRFWK